MDYNILFEKISSDISISEKIEIINSLKLELHELSPFKNEPVDCVIWVKNENVFANDYNPNAVASPEMELLKLSIESDWYTQPIVTMDEEDKRTVIDWFHRNRVWKEYENIRDRIHWYLPVVTINKDREDISDRMAATIRHNRARWEHKVESMSNIIMELKKRRWTDEKIGKELWMDKDEVLRLAQITWLAELFADKDFSNAWEMEESDFEEINYIEND